ncbi:MAG TPA: DNA-binding protein [Thioploca sp.]|nr:DNA-binding protein [Thioploca sp.]
MNTNQIMTVKIGNFGVLEIGHKTMMGKVSQVLEMGNRNRKAKNLEPIPLKEILRKQDLWEFIISRHTQLLRNSNCGESPHLKNSHFNNDFNPDKLNFITIQSDYGKLKEFKTAEGKIQYGELIKQFSNLIQSKKGKYGGTWAELYILLKIASMLDKDLEVEIYRVFIEENLLSLRDIGGDYYKELNMAINTLPDRKDKNNHGIYIQIAKQFREKLEILNTKGYNEEEHNAFIQDTRAKWLNNLIFSIDTELVTSYKQLTKVLEKLN